MSGNDSTRRRRLVLAGVVLACVATGAVLARIGDAGGDPPGPPPTAGVPATSQPSRPGDGAPDAERDDEGAARSAVRFASLSQGWLYETDEAVRSGVLAIATPLAGPALADLTVADVAAARAELGESPGPVWWVVHPLATRVVASTPSAAEVEVWVVTVLAAVGVAAPQAEWLTVTLDLAWTDGGWRVESIRDRPGPSPMLGPRDQPWDAAPFATGLDGFTRLDGGPVDGAVPS